MLHEEVYVASVESGTTSGVIEVTLSDGSRFFVLEALWLRCGMEEDDYCSVARVEELQLQSQMILAEHKAVELLARREYSRHELLLRLVKRGFDRHAVELVLDQLASRGLQDDARYAHAWIESALRRRPQSATQLLLGLRAKGVSSATAGRALEEYRHENPGWEQDALQRALQRARRNRRADRQQLTATLARLGFAPGAIRAALGGEGSAEEQDRGQAADESDDYSDHY